MAMHQPHLVRTKALVVTTCFFCNSVIQKGETVYAEGPEPDTTNKAFCQKCSESRDENLLINYKKPLNQAKDEKQQPLP